MNPIGYVRHLPSEYKPYNQIECRYRRSDNKIELLREDSLLCDTIEEAMEQVKMLHPDIEEGYGFVYNPYNTDYGFEVYKEAGIITKDLKLVKKILQKHGELPLYDNHLMYNARHTDGFVIRSVDCKSYIKYSEKTAKDRAKRKEKKKAAPVLTVTALRFIIIRALRLVPRETSLVADLITSQNLRFSNTVSVHERALFEAETLAYHTDLVKADERFADIKADYNRHVDQNLYPEETVKAIKICNQIFKD